MKTLRIRACHDAELHNMRPDQPGAILLHGAWHRIVHVKRPAFVGSPRSVLWWWNKKPVVFTGDFFFPLCAVKSWVTVK